MTLKFEIDSLEGLDETVKPFYKEGEEGKYVLAVEGVVPESKFNAVNQKAVDHADEAARRRKTVERVLGKLGLESADGLDAALEELTSKAKAPPKKDDADHQAVIRQFKEAADAEKQALQKQLDTIRVGAAKDQFTASLMSQGFSDKVASMIAASNMGRVSFDDAGNMRIMQENGSPLAGSGADGFATVGDLSKELAAAMPELLTDTGKGGGGKPPASGTQGSNRVMKREDWRKLDPSSRSEFFKSGGSLSD